MSGSLRAIVVKLAIFAAFTLAVTGLLAAVIGNIKPFTQFYEVRADFEDATGLLINDVVRIAGVDVGKVIGAQVTEEGQARVAMQIRDSVALPSNTRAAIRFRNLVGQRMVQLSRPDEPAEPLPRDGTGLIPSSQTSPAFDLGTVFNNLQPTLQALNPEDANIVTRALVEILRGREQTVLALVDDLADVSQTLGERGPVIQKLVDDLDPVLSNLVSREAELDSILTSFDQILSTLAARAPELGRAVQNIGSVSNDVADLLEGNRPALDLAISQLADLLAIASAHKEDLDATLANLPDTTHALNRATTYGEWANLLGVCVNGVCSGEAAGNEGVAGIFRFAAGGAR